MELFIRLFRKHPCFFCSPLQDILLSARQRRPDTVLGHSSTVTKEVLCIEPVELRSPGYQYPG